MPHWWDIVIAVAKRFYVRIETREGNREFFFFKRWLADFKKRYDIKSYIRHGKDIFVDKSKPT